MVTTNSITRIISSYRRIGVARAAKELGISYKDLRNILTKEGITIARGRKRGSGIGRSTNGGKVDRRVKWQTEMIENGRCTGCGKPNNSASMYHCEECLKRRNDAKQAK